jgi:flagellum-specific ATP synthase
VFSILPKLLERSGTNAVGSITGFYAILVEGDDMDEPISDAVRGILDGHVVLSRRLAQRYHFPAIDVLDSVSRLANVVTSPELQDAAGHIRRLLAVYREAEDLINVGAYAAGSNRDIDEALEKLPAINAFLRQSITEKSTLEEMREQLLAILSGPGAQLSDVSVGAAEYAQPAVNSVSAILSRTQEDDA